MKATRDRKEVQYECARSMRVRLRLKRQALNWLDERRRQLAAWVSAFMEQVASFFSFYLRSNGFNLRGPTTKIRK